MFKTLNLFIKCLKPWSLRGALPPYQGFALDPLGALSGHQYPHPIILHPPFLIPGYGPDSVTLDRFRKLHLDVMRYESAEACRVSKFTFIPQKRIDLLKFLFHIMGRLVPAHNDSMECIKKRRY